MERSGMRDGLAVGEEPGLRHSALKTRVNALKASFGLRGWTDSRTDIRKDSKMATYVVLANFTEQGIKNVMDTPKRAEAVKALAQKTGVTMKEVYWTLGTYDIVGIFEAPDEASMTALGLSLGKLGNVRTQTLRAFTAADMKDILGKVV
jgi:uncharacterized protein with GYD domain